MQIKNFCNVVNQYEILGDDGGHYLQSYDSVVVRILDGKITLGADWNYSRTTTKYVCRFLKMTTDEIRKALKKGEIAYGRI